MMPCRFPLLALPALLLVAGCSLSTPSANFYTLSSTAAAVPAGGGSKLAVGILLTEFPAPLDRPQIMVRDGENRLEIKEFDRWAGPLDRQFLVVLTDHLVALTGSQQIAPIPWDLGRAPERRLSLAVLRFDGALEGSALLRVRWALIDADGQLRQLHTSVLEEPAGATIETLVAAQSRLVARLAGEIADALAAPTDRITPP